MATKDIGQGWGDLPRSLTEWKCPVCVAVYPIADWQIVLSEIGGVKMDGRKCPVCEFKAYQSHESRRMDPIERVSVEPPVIPKPKRKRAGVN